MKKTLTESEHIRKMLESFQGRDYFDPSEFEGPDYLDTPQYQSFIEKLTPFKNELKQLQAKVKQNPKEAYREYMAKFEAEEGEFSNFVVDVFPGNIHYEDFLVKLEDMQEERPRKASELASLIEQTISWFSSFEDFVEENAEKIVDHFTDNDGSDAGVDMPEEEPPKYYDGTGSY